MHRQTLWTKNFTIITLGTIISAAGGAAMNIALSLVVFDNTDSAWMTGFYSAISMLPSVLLPVFLAPYIDSHSRKRIIVALDALMGLCYLAFGGYILSRGFDYLSYLLFGVLTGTLGSIYSTAYSAFYPDLIPKGFMQKGYSVSSIIYPTVTVVVAPLAALVYSQWGIHVLFFAKGVLLLIASSFEALIRVQELHAATPRRFSPREYLDEIAEGLRYLKAEKGVRSLYSYMAVTNATGQANTLMTLAYFQSTPALGAAMYSLLVSAETIGRMLGGLLHYFIKIPPAKRYTVARSVYQTYEVLDGALLFLPYLGMVAARFLCGFLGVNSATLRETAIQRHLPSNMRARINSLLSVTIQAAVMITQLLAGALGEVLPYRAVTVLFAGFALVCVYLLVQRNRKPIEELMNVPDEPETENMDALCS